jgi:hypothetical protein
MEIKGPGHNVVRLEQTKQGALGALLINGLVFCWTLQPDVTDEHFQIPAALYDYRRFHGVKHPDTYEIIVPGHTALLFHSGNTEADTEGCILLGGHVGTLKGERAVLESENIFKDFMKIMGNTQAGKVMFIDCY